MFGDYQELTKRPKPSGHSDLPKAYGKESDYLSNERLIDLSQFKRPDEIKNLNIHSLNKDYISNGRVLGKYNEFEVEYCVNKAIYELALGMKGEYVLKYSKNLLLEKYGKGC